MIKHTQFYFVRHGQTDWNLQRKLQGRSDVRLNATGLAQAETAREKLAGHPIQAIFTSPLSRARKTAEVINEKLNVPVTQLDDLSECNFGPHEGTFSYDWLTDWLAGDTSTTPPEVEPYEDFLARGAAAINQAITSRGPILIVAHGGIYLPIRQVLGETSNKSINNCQPVRLDPPSGLEKSWRATYL